MMMKILLICICFVFNNEAKIIVETGKLFFTTIENKDNDTFFNTVHHVALSNFGNLPYGTNFKGKITYSDEKSNQISKLTKIPINYACETFKDTEFSNKIRNSREKQILLIERGPYTREKPCKFTEKIKNAQEAGADAVIFINKNNELVMPDMSDDYTNYIFMDEIKIPSLMITHKLGSELKEKLKSHTVYATFDLKNLFNKSDKNEIELFLNGNPDCGYHCQLQYNFIKEFKKIALELDEIIDIKPYYVIWNCPEEYKETRECQRQCIYKGNYCYPDPDKDINEGLSGRDIILENLRSMCLYKISKESKNSHIWWNYIELIHRECSLNRIGKYCSYQVFEKIGAYKLYNNSGMNYWNDCIRENKIDEEIKHDLLDENMIAQKGIKLRKYDGVREEGSVIFAPSIKINGRHYRGNFESEQIINILCDLLNENGKQFNFCKKSQFSSENEINKLNFIYTLFQLIKGYKLIIITLLIGYCVTIMILMSLLKDKKLKTENSIDEVVSVNNSVSSNHVKRGRKQSRNIVSHRPRTRSQTRNERLNVK